MLSAREQDLLLSMINSQLQPCAKMPGGGGGADTPIVNVRFRLRQDGSLDGEPVVVDRQNTPLYAIAADASIRAIKQCAPFQLPPDKYCVMEHRHVGIRLAGHLRARAALGMHSDAIRL